MNITKTAFSAAVRTFYEKRFLARALPRLVHGRWANRARVSKQGAVYELTKYGSLAAVTAQLTEGTTPPETQIGSRTTLTMSPKWYGAWMGFTDEVDMEVQDPVISEMTGLLGEQAGVSLDYIYRTVLAGDSTIDFAGNAAQITDLEYPTHEFCFMDIMIQYAELTAANAMPMNTTGYAVILHPYSYATLFNDPIFVNLFVRESDPIRTGYVGKLLDMEFFVTSNAYVQADAGANNADVYSAIFIGKDSHGAVSIVGYEPTVADGGGDKLVNNTGKAINPVRIITKPVGQSGSDDPLDQRGTIGWKTSAEVKILQSAWIRNCKHTNMFS